MQMEELNKSVVYKLRPSNYQKKTGKSGIKELPKKPSGTDDVGDQDDIPDQEDDSKNFMNIY